MPPSPLGKAVYCRCGCAPDVGGRKSDLATGVTPTNELRVEYSPHGLPIIRTCSTPLSPKETAA
eukprot:204251-Prorocentrum_minimum.AAC.1